MLGYPEDFAETKGREGALKRAKYEIEEFKASGSSFFNRFSKRPPEDAEYGEILHSTSVSLFVS